MSFWAAGSQSGNAVTVQLNSPHCLQIGCAAAPNPHFDRTHSNAAGQATHPGGLGAVHRRQVIQDPLILQAARHKGRLAVILKEVNGTCMHASAHLTTVEVIWQAAIFESTKKRLTILETVVETEISTCK